MFFSLWRGVYREEYEKCFAELSNTMRTLLMEMQDFPFCFEHSYETDDSKHFSDEIVENDFAYFIVENYEHSCRNVKEILKRRE